MILDPTPWPLALVHAEPNEIKMSTAMLGRPQNSEAGIMPTSSDYPESFSNPLASFKFMSYFCQPFQEQFLTNKIVITSLLWS